MPIIPPSGICNACGQIYIGSYLVHSLMDCFTKNIKRTYNPITNPIGTTPWQSQAWGYIPYTEEWEQFKTDCLRNSIKPSNESQEMLLFILPLLTQETLDCFYEEFKEWILRNGSLYTFHFHAIIQEQNNRELAEFDRKNQIRIEMEKGRLAQMTFEQRKSYQGKNKPYPYDRFLKDKRKWPRD